MPQLARTRFGVNYVPSSGWFYSWLDFEPDDVRRDLSDIAALGADHVRIFPVWPWIQPNRGYFSRRALQALVATIDCAAEFGLDVAVDLLQGHLSSFDFLPSWMLTWHQASLFTDDRVHAGLVDYVATVSSLVAARSNVFALTLGNEVNNLWPGSPTTLGRSHDWAASLMEVMRQAAPELACVYSLCDDAWTVSEHPFAPTDATELGDATSVHAWVFSGAAALDGPLGPATVAHGDYLLELAAAAGEPGRAIWLQEIGAPQPDIPKQVAAEFASRALALAGAHPDVRAVTWWCSHDVSRALLDFPGREYDLGLYTVDHVRKPVGAAFAEFIAGYRQHAPQARPALIAPPGDLPDRAQFAPGSAFHRAWVALREQGPTAIVQADRADDPQHLAARGIGRVLVPDA